MSQNKMKIVSIQNPKSLSFFFMNEKGKWYPVSNSSELSRKKFTSADICEFVEDIVSIIDRDYNTGEQGVDIQFEGPEDEYSYLQQCIAKHFKDKGIDCCHKKTKIAVAGKIGSGKSTFIEEMCKCVGNDFSSVTEEGYKKYISNSTNMIWYEISGIDIGKENIIAAQKTFDYLAEEEITDFVYCLSASKIEKLEEDLIYYVRETYHSVDVLLLLTNYLDDGNESFIEKLSSQLDGIKVIPVMARSRKTRNGIIESYGLDNVKRYLFEGK